MSPDLSNNPGSAEELARYQHTLERYERLMEISRSMNSTLDLNLLLEQIVVAASELTETEAASIPSCC